MIHVGATELGIATGCLDFKHALAEFHDRHVQRATTKVDHRNAQFFAGAIEAIRQRCGCRFVDQSFDFETRDSAGILGRAALVVVEIGGHGDNGFGDRFAEKSLRIVLYFLQQEGG